MDKNSKKVLKFFNSHSNEIYSAATVYKIFPELSPRDILEIIHFLSNNDYLRVIKGNMYQSTNKGKTYNEVIIKNWISKYIVSIFALFISIVALIFSGVALFNG